MELSRLPSQPKEVKSAEEEYLTEACDRNEIDQLLNENDNHWLLSALETIEKNDIYVAT